MDRMLKEPEWVTVHENDKDGPRLDVFRQRPYSMYGFDNYMYKLHMYKGFVREDGSAYILLSEPLFKEAT